MTRRSPPAISVQVQLTMSLFAAQKRARIVRAVVLVTSEGVLLSRESVHWPRRTPAGGGEERGPHKRAAILRGLSMTSLSRPWACALTMFTFVGSSLAFSQTHWMEDNWATLGNRTLAQVTLPGTHDSGAFNLTTALEPGDSADPVFDALIEAAEALGIPIQDIITPWAKAQDLSFLEQLNAGIRYIDFRAGYDGTSWHTFHFEEGTLCSDLINQIATFLSSTPKEVVVIEVSHTSGGPVTESAKLELAKILNDTLGRYMLPVQSSLPTLDAMVTAGHRALVSFDDDGVNAAYPTLWNGDYIVNSYANSANLTTMIQYNNAEVKSFQTFEGPGLFKISWTLTPDANCIIDGYLFPNLPTSLIALADSANPSLAPWAAKYFGAGQPVANIVIVDHLETSAVVKVAATSSAQSFPLVTVAT